MSAAEDNMYLVVCEFLLLKPSLDVANVPEFYKLFYSAKLEVMPCTSIMLWKSVVDSLRSESVTVTRCESG